MKFITKIGLTQRHVDPTPKSHSKHQVHLPKLDMHTTKPHLHTRRALATTALLLATFSADALRAQVTNLSGDHRVIPQSSEPGNLDADGDLGWGRTPGSPGAVAGKLRYFESPAQLAFDATEADAIFTWNDDATDTLRDFKMKLDANNMLSLYKTDGSAASISLTPDTGAIKLAGTGAGLFNGSGGGILQIDGSGRPYFASKPIFQDGVDFGSGGTLNSSKVQYLQGVLTNLGYDPNAGTYTDVTKVSGGTLTIADAVYANGYVHWTGYFWGSTKIGSTTYTDSNGKYLVGKSNPNGSTVWIKQIQMADPSSAFNPESIAVNASGTVAITGLINGATTNLGAQNLSNAGGADGYVLVLNSSGTPQWSKVLSSSGYDRAYGVAVDSSGNVAVVGSFESSGFNYGSGSTLSTAGGYDGYVVKYNSSGTPSWAAPAGGTAGDLLQTVKFASSGNVIIGGSIGGATTNLGSYNLTYAGNSDAWVGALNSSGTVQWTKAIAGTGIDNIAEIAVDASGNIYAATGFAGTTTTLGAHNKTSAGNSDGLVTALNSSGTVQWATAIGGTGADALNSIALDSGGAVVLSATHPSATTTLGAYNIGAGGAVVTLNSSGAATAAQAFGAANQLSLKGAVPLGSLSSGLALYGNTGSNVTVGDTRIASGNFLVTVPQSSVSTPPTPTPTAFAWNGGVAENTNGIAVGSSAYAGGLGSIAFGEGSATGNGAFAAGSSRATGDASFAFGTSSNAYAPWATAIGSNMTAAGMGSVAIGMSGSAASTGSISIGDGNFVSGSYAVGIGSGGFANGDMSVTLGEYNTTNGHGSVAMGGWNTAEGDYSTATGISTVAAGAWSFSANNSTWAQAFGSTAFGQLNIGGGSSSAWVETDPLFEIGNSTDFGNKANALTTRKNGRTTLTNKAWKAAVALDPEEVLEDPEATNDDGGDALIVEGHTRLKGKVLIEPQGDLSMGEFTGGEAP